VYYSFSIQKCRIGFNEQFLQLYFLFLLHALINDYEAMKDMLYGNIPSFDIIMESVRQLEKEINSL